MKYIILAFFILLSFNTKAQYFNNVNNELCYQLYTLNDNLGEFRVFVVIDSETFTSKDSVILSKLQNLSYGSRSSIAQRWVLEGKRIEVERAPYITKPPVFLTENRKIIMYRIKQYTDWENSPWKNAKKFWEYEDRPF